MKPSFAPGSVKSFAVLLFFHCVATIQATEPFIVPSGRPNILVVIADQWRAQAFGFAGDPNVKTPHLDRLASQSVRLINAVAGTPVCSPTRASFMTGQRPLTHGIFMNDVPLATNAVTIAKVFKNAGYSTGYIGKWHLNAHGRSNFIPRERRQGFEYWKVLECSHSYNRSFYYADGPEKLQWPGYDAIAQTEDAGNYIRKQASDKKPFLLFLAWGPPHDPYHSAPQQYRELYSASNMKLRPNVSPSEQKIAKQNLAGYYAHCTALDDCMASLRRTLQESGIADNTIVVFTSEHGDLLGSQNGGKKLQPYDESIRVPMLFHWPAGLGLKPAKLDAPMNSEDLMPTLLGLCHLEIPSGVEGFDYSSYFRGGKNPSDGATVIRVVAPFDKWSRKEGEYRGIRTTRYTYVRKLSGPWLLFDNEKDPYQMHNLIGKQPQLQRKLDAQLKAKLQDAKDEFLPAEAYIQKWGYTVNPATGAVPYDK